MEISNQEFDQIVRHAVAEMDSRFRDYLDEVPVIIEELPDKVACRQLGRTNPNGLLGLYRGTPLNHRSVTTGFTPSQIFLYRKNILRICKDKTALTQQIQKTLIHELGHYLGFSESQLRSHGQ